MKKVLALLIIIFIGIPLLMFGLWYFQEKRPINILIIDKTVLKKAGNEHNSFNWVLTQNRYVRLDSNNYVISQDYKGFFPLGKFKYKIDDLEKNSEEEIDSLATGLDAVYLTDVYGVYFNDWFPRDANALKPSKKIYGGLTNKDYMLMKKMKDQHKLILSEFNLIASPTKSAIRENVEKEFHLNWSGWTGRYFESLDTSINKEIPKWVTEMYKHDNDDEWPFKKSGIVLVSNYNTICVLENEIDLTYPAPEIHTNFRGQEYYGVPETMNYPFWFDVMYTDSVNQVVSNYYLKTTAQGDSILKKHGLRNYFPAVIRHIGDDYDFYYFAGDFSDNKVQHFTSYFKGIKKFSFLLVTGDQSDRRSFFWNYYTPMIAKIMDDYDQKIKRNKLLAD